MNQDTITQTPAQPRSASRLRRRLGVGLSGLVVLFLAFDGITKVLRVAPVMEACQKMGISPNTAVGIGLLLLTCTIVYVIPRTAIFGAILLTGYLGGAVATHVRVSGSLFEILFPVIMGVFVWGGLYLRDARLRRLIPLHQGD